MHAFWRALLLVLLGVFLRSIGRSQTNWTFEDTLTQIGLGYGFLYLLALRPGASNGRRWWSFSSATGWRLPSIRSPGLISIGSPAGIASDWPQHLTGFAAHWNKNTNLAWAFDIWFSNLFPRQHPFTNNGGGYCTLNFIPTLGTMLLGLLAGGMLQSGRTRFQKVRWLATAGIVGLAAGWSLDAAGICPVVKRIWTPSWVLFSGGWCLLLLAGFYLVMDIWQRRNWAFPLVVLGMNSIAAYLIAHLFVGFIGKALSCHLGPGVFQLAGNAYQPLLHGAGILLVEWMLLALDVPAKDVSANIGEPLPESHGGPWNEVTVYSLDGDWSIFRREIVFGAKNVGRKQGPVPFSGANAKFQHTGETRMKTNTQLADNGCRRRDFLKLGAWAGSAWHWDTAQPCGLNRPNRRPGRLAFPRKFPPSIPSASVSSALAAWAQTTSATCSGSKESKSARFATSSKARWRACKTWS